MDSALLTVTDRIRAAAASYAPLRIRGGGTKDFYGQSLDGDVLDVTPLSGITSYEPSELVVTVRGGTPLAALEAALAEKNQSLAFEPPHFGPRATVGGMVAAGLSGPARPSVGAVRDYILGATIVNGRGEVLVYGGQVMKNVAGYDVSRLMAGSMGTLAVLAEVSLKVLPVAPAEATLRFDLDETEALARLNQWGGQPLPLNASCWVNDGGQPVLYLRLRGAVAAVESACQKLGGQRQANAAVAADWAACREHTLPFFANPPSWDLCLWRVSVPQTAPALSLPHPQLIEWHGGLRWLWAPASAAPAIRARALALGGHATLFRAASVSDKSVGVFQPLAAPVARIHRELRKQFDPAGIFNPGRLGGDAN